MPHALLAVQVRVTTVLILSTAQLAPGVVLSVKLTVTSEQVPGVALADPVAFVLVSEPHSTVVSDGHVMVGGKSFAPALRTMPKQTADTMSFLRTGANVDMDLRLALINRERGRNLLLPKLAFS
jgi:hypothetical protein